MRFVLPFALAPLLAACWTPGPGQIDPTRYPWDQPQAKAAAKGSYCIISLETPAASGITTGEPDGVQLACNAPPNSRPKPN
jgi:hypothetical protein